MMPENKDSKDVSDSTLMGIAFALAYILNDKSLSDDKKIERLAAVLKLNPKQKNAKEAALSLLKSHKKEGK